MANGQRAANNDAMEDGKVVVFHLAQLQKVEALYTA